MLKRATIIAVLVMATPVFSASVPTAQQCKNPNSTNALCLFSTTGQAGLPATSDAASAMVAMVGSVCALPLRVMSQFGQNVGTAEAPRESGTRQ